MFLPGAILQVRLTGNEAHLRRPARTVRVITISGRLVYTDRGVFHYRQLEVGPKSKKPDVARAHRPLEAGLQKLAGLKKAKKK